MLSNQITKLECRIAQLQAQLDTKLAREKEEHRKCRNRRLIIWGVVVECALERGDISSSDFLQLIEIYAQQRDKKAALDFDFCLPLPG